MDLSSAVWRKSSYSGGNGGTCVEVAVLPGASEGSHRVVAVRDSKNPTDPVLILSVADWRTFTVGVRDGQFDLA
jgi:hypothetical protein